MKRTAAALTLACAAGTVAFFAAGGAAQAADSTVQAGWWTATNPGSVEGSPTPPPPPDVPARGLLVEGGAQSTTGKGNTAPTAFGAVVIQLPVGTSARRLSLTVAPNSATTPSAQLELCPLANPALPVEYGGPMADAPIYNCTHNVTAGASSDGSHYIFNVASIGSDGTLAVAILPTSPVDRVAFSAPNDKSLALQSSARPTNPAPQPSSATGSGSGGTSAGNQSTSTSVGTAPTLPGTLPPTAPTTRPQTPAQQTPQVATAPESNYQPTGIPATAAMTPARANPHTVIVLLAALLLGLVLWQIVGRAAVEAALRN